MTDEDEEFNRIEREAKQRMEAVSAAVTPREWVGLTDEELDKLALDAGIITWVRKVYDDADRKFYDLPLGEGMTGENEM
jgi:hypothetical protein